MSNASSTTPAAMSSASSEVDVSVWRALVGSAIKIPPVNAYIYYFPQGHLQQSSDDNDPINYNFTLLRPWIPCQVLSLNFLAKHSSDQPCVKFLLHPLQPLAPRPLTHFHNNSSSNNNDIVSFVKILTRSDSKRAGGLSMPRQCAEMILPQLNYTSNPVHQNLVMRDVHNTAWRFRHVYRGTPRRHMLATGWHYFVSVKRLVAGDSVVFMKKRSTGELFIGIRRALKAGGSSREEALAAVEMAARGRPFEVMYYPGTGVAEFVVDAERAKEAIRRRWSPGTRVRMAMEMNDTWRMTLIHGVVAGVMMPNRGMWCGSPWRMLQVNWGEPNTAQHVTRVSPWQVEDITPAVDRPSKRLRALQYSEMLQPREERALPLHTTEPTRSISTQSSTSVPHHALQFPYSVQGARLYDKLPELKLVENSYPGILLPAPHNSVQLNAAAARCSSSFQLFGKTIKVSEHRDGRTSHNAEVRNVQRLN